MEQKACEKRIERKISTIGFTPLTAIITAFRIGKDNRKDAQSDDTDDTIVKDARIGLYILIKEVGRVLSSEKRMEILRLLDEYAGKCTFSDIMRATGRNPKSIRDDLRLLEKYGFIEHRDNTYIITDVGRMALDAEISGIKEILESAIRAYEEYNKKNMTNMGSKKE